MTNLFSILSAIAMLETGAIEPGRCKEDYEVGRAGEISRYQIKKSIWKLHGGRNPSDPNHAKQVAGRIIKKRIQEFVEERHRQPTAREIYALWNAPAYVYTGKKLPGILSEKCRRFENLYRSLVYENEK